MRNRPDPAVLHERARHGPGHVRAGAVLESRDHPGMPADAPRLGYARQAL
tara:strand:- start:153 stop:302 length:150 start_codon:yes stop_codon:yes gene_type:complete